MAVMGVNIKLHLLAGLALLLAYAVVLVAGAVAPGRRPLHRLTAWTATRPRRFARPRPRRAGLDATTTLQNFALVTFDVDPAAAAALPPASIPSPDTRRWSRSGLRLRRVSFRDVDFRFALAAMVRVSFFQTNYRAYVRGPDGRRAVFFFGTTLDSPLGRPAAALWGMPWHRVAPRSTRSGMTRRLPAYRHRCTGRSGSATWSCPAPLTRSPRLDGFADADDAAHVLTHPLDGYFLRPSGRLGRYAVWHDRLRPTLGDAAARYAVFERPRTRRPAGAALGPAAAGHRFDVLLPPRRA